MSIRSFKEVLSKKFKLTEKELRAIREEVKEERTTKQGPSLVHLWALWALWRNK